MDQDTTAVDQSANDVQQDDYSWDDAAAEHYGTQHNDDAAKEDTDDDAQDSADSEQEAESNDTTQLDEDAQDADQLSEAPQLTMADYRRAQRDIQQDTDSMREDVLKALYPDFTTEILDADGDPIRTPADVMGYINEVTGEPFTAEEAVAWLMQRNQAKQQEMAEIERYVDEVADTNMTIRDESLEVRQRYGDFLDKNPELRDQIYADYRNTLVVHKTAGIILHAPISLLDFYDRSLKPYIEYAAQLQSDAAARQQKESQSKEAERKERRTAQADRGDLLPSAPGHRDKDEDEWADAAREYYKK